MSTEGMFQLCDQLSPEEKLSFLLEAPIKRRQAFLEEISLEQAAHVLHSIPKVRALMIVGLRVLGFRSRRRMCCIAFKR